MNGIVCLAMLALHRPWVRQCPLLRLLSVQACMLEYFSEGVFVTNHFGFFLHSKRFFVCSLCSSLTEPFASAVNHTIYLFLYV